MCSLCSEIAFFGKINQNDEESSKSSHTSDWTDDKFSQNKPKKKKSTNLMKYSKTFKSTR